MNKARPKTILSARGAIIALVTGMLVSALPVQAQDRGNGRGERTRAERFASPERPRQGAVWSQRREGRAQGSVGVATPQAGPTYGSDRRGDYGARRRGGEDRARDWAAQRQAREAAGQQQQQQQQQGTWARSGSPSWQGARPTGTAVGTTVGTGGWQRDGSYGARTREWRREQRDDARNYASGYRDGRRDDNRWDNRYGTNQRRWDNRSWRSDNRYDWYRYRASNRSLFSLGRYYAPYRGYSYSRINIGFRLGSPFYANRYWINDPWQYRLPAVYGNYRWIRYYDDALLVDVYSGEVVDAIHNFFW